MTKIIDTGTGGNLRLRSLAIALALAAAGPAVEFAGNPWPKPARQRYETDRFDDESIAAAEAKRARKNAKRLKDATQP